MNYEITASLGIITIPIKKGDACEGLNSGCPYQAGVLNKHVATIEITDQYIETEATVKIQYKDEAGRNEICVLADVEIVA